MKDQKERDIKRLLKYRRINEFTDCWEWTGIINKSGAGSIHVTVSKNKYRKVDVYRFAYQVLTGVVLTSNEILHHGCHNKSCFNPDHLEPTTQKINMLRKSEDWQQFYSENKELVDQYDAFEKKVKSIYFNWKKKVIPVFD